MLGNRDNLTLGDRMRASVHVEKFDLTQRNMVLACAESLPIGCAEFNMGKACLSVLNPGPIILVTCWSGSELDCGVLLLLLHIQFAQSFLYVSRLGCHLSDMK